jgi:hypothetical protein
LEVDGALPAANAAVEINAKATVKVAMRIRIEFMMSSVFIGWAGKPSFGLPVLPTVFEDAFG